jgi:hypothetical protein
MTKPSNHVFNPNDIGEVGALLKIIAGILDTSLWHCIVMLAESIMR